MADEMIEVDVLVVGGSTPSQDEVQEYFDGAGGKTRALYVADNTPGGFVRIVRHSYKIRKPST